MTHVVDYLGSSDSPTRSRAHTRLCKPLGYRLGLSAAEG
jgi:hypothetical protein